MSATNKEEKKRAIHSPSSNPLFKRHTPFTAPWVAERLKDSPDRAIPILRDWSHSKRFHEINGITINLINRLNHDDAIEALDDLRKRHTFIRGTRGQRLSVKTTVVTLDTNVEYGATALVLP